MSDNKTKDKAKEVADKARKERREKIACINERIAAIKKARAERIEKSSNPTSQPLNPSTSQPLNPSTPQPLNVSQ